MKDEGKRFRISDCGEEMSDVELRISDLNDRIWIKKNSKNVLSNLR